MANRRGWPFADPPNVMTISLRDIMERRRPILFVQHDDDEAPWQFLDGRQNPDPEDGVVLSLDCILALDASIAELADLPVGWRAWRDSPTDSWQREPAD